MAIFWFRYPLSGAFSEFLMGLYGAGGVYITRRGTKRAGNARGGGAAGAGGRARGGGNGVDGGVPFFVYRLCPMSHHCRPVVAVAGIVVAKGCAE